MITMIAHHKMKDFDWLTHLQIKWRQDLENDWLSDNLIIKLSDELAD